jgi:catechol 2,3-dioxygenase-like lactoylglutathione lyase family enzyme
LFSHVFLATRDFGRALAFYRPLLALLGVAERFCDPAEGWAGWQSSPGPRPLLVLGKPFEGEHEPGNGQMVALLATSRALVDQAHALALAQCGRCEGPPGLRPHYHPNYYGAYFRDPDGNKLCVACHEAPSA